MATNSHQQRLQEKMSDIPNFYGNGKDGITAENFIKRIEAAQATLSWSDEETYNYFSWALREKAQKWLTSLEYCDTKFEKKWSFIKNEFKKYFCAKLDQTALLVSLRDLSMKSTEDPLDFFSRVTEVIQLINDTVTPGQIANMPEAITPEFVEKVNKESHQNAIRSLISLFFVAGLPKNLQKPIVQMNTRDPAACLDSALKNYELKKATPEKKVDTGSDDEMDTDKTIKAIRQHQVVPTKGKYMTDQATTNQNSEEFQKPSQYQNQTRELRQKARKATGTQCYFCKRLGHFQERCILRINLNIPCTNTKTGQSYWPKQAMPIYEENEQVEDELVEDVDSFMLIRDTRDQAVHYVQEDEEREVIATKVRGNVKWFNTKLGYGFINCNDTNEDVFIHRTAIIKNNPRSIIRSLGNGEVVEFDIIVGKKGNQASNVTGPDGVSVQGSPYATNRYPDRFHHGNQGFYPQDAMRPWRRNINRGQVVTKEETDEDKIKDSTEETEHETEEQFYDCEDEKGYTGETGSENYNNQDEYTNDDVKESETDDETDETDDLNSEEDGSDYWENYLSSKEDGSDDGSDYLFLGSDDLFL